MKTFTKNSRARLLTLSLIALSCNIQADVTSNINGGDATKTLLSLSTAIAAIPTSLVNISSLATTTDVGNIEGTSFDYSRDSLHNISNNTITVPFATAAALLQVISQLQSDPVLQVSSAAANLALTTTPASLNEADFSSYTGALATAQDAISTAIADSQSSANTRSAQSALQRAISDFNSAAVSIDGTDYLISGYSIAQISWALQQLNYALAYLLTQQPNA